MPEVADVAAKGTRIIPRGKGRGRASDGKKGGRRKSPLALSFSLHKMSQPRTMRKRGAFPTAVPSLLAPKGHAMSHILLGLAAIGGLLVSAAPSPEPVAIELEIRCGKASKTAHAESAAPAAPDAKPKDRDVLEVKAGDRVTVQWKLNSTDAKAKLEDVTVHFFAVKVDQAGQQAPPKLLKGVVAESALTMDFGPDNKNEGQLSFTLDKPGCYLFRVETIGAAAGPAGHEDFAALEVTAR